jgi:hypothetical protein
MSCIVQPRNRLAGHGTQLVRKGMLEMDAIVVSVFDRARQMKIPYQPPPL